MVNPVIIPNYCTTVR